MIAEPTPPDQDVPPTSPVWCFLIYLGGSAVQSHPSRTVICDHTPRLQVDNGAAGRWERPPGTLVSGARGEMRETLGRSRNGDRRTVCPCANPPADHAPLFVHFAMLSANFR